MTKEEIEKLVVTAFWHDTRPTFRQGVPTHESEEVFTANDAQNMCNRIEELTKEKHQLSNAYLLLRQRVNTPYKWML